MVKLGEVSKIVSGGTPKTSISEYWDGDVPWLTPKDLSDSSDFWIGNGARCISELGLAKSSAILLPKGAVLWSSRAPIGLVALARNPIATNQGFKNFIPDNILDPEYLAQYLIYARPAFQELGVGATFKEVSATRAAEIQIPLPPLNEQKRIAEILGGVAESVKATENEIGKLEQLSFSVVNSFITREVTETQPLHELVTFRGGSTPSKKNVDFWSDGEIRWFSSKDLKADELVDSLDHITTTALKDTALKPVSENKTIAISLRGMSLAHRVPMSIIPGHSCVNQDLKALAPADGVDIRVLFALLKQQEPFLLTKVATSAHGTKKLDFPHLRDLEVPALSLQNISTLKIQLDELAKWRSCLDQKLALLQELQRSLSARLFDGRL